MNGSIHGERRYLTRNFILFAVLVPVLVVLSSCWSSKDQGRLEDRPFDSASWKTANPRIDQVRLQMVDDLLRTQALNGATRSDVEMLLGDLGSTPFDAESGGGYDLGLEDSSPAVDHAWLILVFENDTVVRAEIVRD